MKAAWYKKQGSAKSVIKTGDTDTPNAKPGEVRVKIAYSGLNPTDIKRRQGFGGQPQAYPIIIPHSDGSGVIDQVGKGVLKSRLNQKVWIWNGQWQRPFGTCAEYICLPSRQAVPLPKKTSLLHGACIGIPAITAHRCLFADGPIKGKTVLITGGAGAVGNYAIQLAKWGGASLIITTVSSESKAKQARMAGADAIINYKKQNVIKRISTITKGAGVDHIVEVAFGVNQPTILAVLKTHGTVACYASDKKPNPMLDFYGFMLRNANLRWVFMYQIPESAFRNAIRDINKWLEYSDPYHPVDKIFPLFKTADAHLRLQSGKAKGNIIISINN